MLLFQKLCNRKFLFQYLATLTGSSAVLTSGINLGWTSPYLPAILNGTNPEIFMTSDEGSWCAVMPLVGAPIGSLLAAIIVDKIGRKRTILCMAPFASLLFVLLAFSKTTFMICVARFIIGSIEGLLYTCLPMYLGEISDPSIRGLLTASISIAAIMGTLFINVIGFQCSIFVSSLICSTIPVIHFLTFMWMPESPYHLIKKQNYEKARESLIIFRGNQNVEEELTILCEAVKRQESDKKTKITDLFTVRSNRYAFMIFVILNVTKKYSGKNPLLFYTTSIFQIAGGTLNAQLSVIIFLSLEAIAATAGIFLVDQTGRRSIIIFSTIGCTISLFCTALYFYLQQQDPLSVVDIGWLPLTALIVYNVCYNFGLELAPTIFLGELFPTNIKAVALGLADTFSIINGTVCSKLYQILSENFGIFVPFCFFAVCCAVGVIFIIKYVPETKNKTLEEIQMYFIKKTNKS